MSELNKALIAIALGVGGGAGGWFITHFVGKQILEFFKLRRTISETTARAAKLQKPRMRRTGMEGTTENADDRSAIESVRSELKTLASDLLAFADAELSARLLGFRYKLTLAGNELTSLAADLEDEAKRALLIKNVRGALKLKT